MSRLELERRIRILEEGIGHFEGMEWIVKVGEMAEMKSALFDMPEGLGQDFVLQPGTPELTALDGDIAVATDCRAPASEQRRAFNSAYEVLRRWLEPNFPGLRTRPKLAGYNGAAAHMALSTRVGTSRVMKTSFKAARSGRKTV